MNQFLRAELRAFQNEHADMVAHVDASPSCRALSTASNVDADEVAHGVRLTTYATLLVDRFMCSCRRLRIPCTYTMEQVKEIVDYDYM